MLLDNGILRKKYLDVVYWNWDKGFFQIVVQWILSEAICFCSEGTYGK